MPRILRIINRFNLGGPTYNAGYLTKFIDDPMESVDDGLQYTTKLIGGIPIKGESHSSHILENLGVTYEEIPEMSRSINPFKDIIAFFKIVRIIREFKPDIIHTHAAKAGALGRLAGWLCGVPIIIHTYHGHVFSNYFGGVKSALVKGVERWLAKRTTSIICISEKQKQDITSIFKIAPAGKTFVIPLGFDLDRFSRDQENKRSSFRNKYNVLPSDVAIGIIGRIAPVKNHPLFIETIADLQSKSNQFRAFVIGDGESKSELIEKCRAIGLDASTNNDAAVVFTSWIKDIDLAMAGLDIVVLTSLNEGTPVSLIEAQAAGRPVVSTNVGGVMDCMQDQHTGYITENNAQSVSQSLLKLIQSEELRKSMGKNGRAFVMHKYSYKRLVAETRILYNMCISSRVR